MPDITMCPGFDCKHRNECYRYHAKPDSHWQSYRFENMCDNDEYHSYLSIAHSATRIVTVEEVEERWRNMNTQNNQHNIEL